MKYPRGIDPELDVSFITDVLERENKEERRLTIEYELAKREIPFSRHRYETGLNLVCDIGSPPYIGISCHYDSVENSPGANDNSSGVAATIEVLRLLKENPPKKIGVRAFFFDEEELDLIGSEAYVRDYGINNLLGIYNLDLVGRGNILALWSVDEKQDTLLLRTLEEVVKNKPNNQTSRFPRIIANTSDHESFRNKGLEDAFTITMIGQEELKMRELYYKALNDGASPEELWKMIEQTPIFRDYHKPTDTWESLNFGTIVSLTGILFESIKKIDSEFKLVS